MKVQHRFRFSPFLRRGSIFVLSPNTTLPLLAVSLGLASGIAIWIFTSLVIFFSHFLRTQLAEEVLGKWIGPLGIMVVLALVGLFVGVVMQRFVGPERHHGVAGIIEAVALGGGHLPYGRMPFKAFSAVLSLGAGASVGPEDPSVQIGANLGSFFGQRLHLSEEQVRLLVAGGGASAIAAAFRAPIAGVFFALEAILNGEFTTGSFGVVVLSAVTSSVFTQAVAGVEPEIGVLTYTLGSPLEVPFYVLLGFLLAPATVVFMRAVYWQRDLWHRVPLAPPLKTALAGVLVACVAIFLPQIMGAGREMMAEVLSGQGTEYTLVLLLLIGLAKLLMTAVSLGGGFQGGVFAPSLFIGTMFGGAFGHLVNAIGPASVTGDPQAYAIAGMAAMMAGVVRAPITAILLVFELTNDYRLIIPIMLTAAICVWVAERFEPSGIYLLGLLRQGIQLPTGREVDVMQGVTVREVMTSPAPTIEETASLQALRDRFRFHNTRSLGVVDGQGQLIGIVTLTDLQRAYESRLYLQKCVGDICTRQVITISPDEPLWKAVRTMGMHGVGRLPVIDPATRLLVGILRRHDIVRAYNIGITKKRQQQYIAEQIRLNNLIGAHVFELFVAPGSPVVGRRIQEVDWPEDSIVASIRRQEKMLVPRGSTELKDGDQLIIVAAPEAQTELMALVSRISDG